MKKYGYIAFSLTLSLPNPLKAAALEAVLTGPRRIVSRVSHLAAVGVSSSTLAERGIATTAMAKAPRMPAPLEAMDGKFILHEGATGVFGPVGLAHVEGMIDLTVPIDDQAKISKIIIYTGYDIDRLEVYKRKKTGSADIPVGAIGGSGGSKAGEEVFKPNEYLVGIIGRIYDNNKLCCIKFEKASKDSSGIWQYKCGKHYGNAAAGNPFSLRGDGPIFRIWGAPGYKKPDGTLASGPVTSLGIETKPFPLV